MSGSDGSRRDWERTVEMEGAQVSGEGVTWKATRGWVGKVKKGKVYRDRKVPRQRGRDLKGRVRENEV